MAPTSSRFVMSAAGQAAMDKATSEWLEDYLVPEIAEDATTRVPVLTGNLRDSISYEVQGLEGRVTADADYASYVELGTSRSSAQPYLKPALYTKRS